MKNIPYEGRKLSAGMNFPISKNSDKIERGPATEARTPAKGL